MFKQLSIILITLFLTSNFVFAAGTFYSSPNSNILKFDSLLRIVENNDTKNTIDNPLSSNTGLRLQGAEVNIEGTDFKVNYSENIGQNRANHQLIFSNGIFLNNTIGFVNGGDSSNFELQNLNSSSSSFDLHNIFNGKQLTFARTSDGFAIDESINNGLHPLTVLPATTPPPSTPWISYNTTNNKFTFASSYDNSNYLQIKNKFKIGSNEFIFNATNNALENTNTILNVLNYTVTTTPSLSVVAREVVNKSWVIGKYFIDSDLLTKLQDGLDFSNVSSESKLSAQTNDSWNTISDPKLQNIPFEQIKEAPAGSSRDLTNVEIDGSLKLPPESHRHIVDFDSSTDKYDIYTTRDCNDPDTDGVYLYELGKPNGDLFNPKPYTETFDDDYDASNCSPGTICDVNQCDVNVQCPANTTIFAFIFRDSDGEIQNDVDNCKNDLFRCGAEGNIDQNQFSQTYFSDNNSLSFSVMSGNGFAFNAYCVGLGNTVYETVENIAHD